MPHAQGFEPPAAASVGRIAYLAPEMPALSATFVHEELLGLERRGVSVLAFSVHRPAAPAPGQEALAERTQVLYGTPFIVDALCAIPSFGRRAFTAAAWLLSDMLEVGPWRLQAWKLAYQWLAGARLGRLLRRGGCTHLHVHFAHVPAQIAMYASAFTGIAFTVMAHANDIFERGLLLRQKAARARKLLTISHFNAAHLRSVGVADEHIAVVRCGVSFPARPDAPCVTARSSCRIGTLGRLVEKKGIDDLMRALAMLHDAQWELRVAGDGPQRAPLEALATELGIGDRVHFEGALAHEAVTAWLRSLDLFALACKPDSRGDMDGIPVVLMEAMSQRVPVVSTRLSGIPELVIDEQTGLLAPPGDAPELAGRLRRLMEDPALRERLTRSAVRHVDAEFGQAVNLDRLMKYLVPAGSPTGRAERRSSPRRRGA
jgi:glycosyltransferase involved in cell wall biosynthesis